MEQLLHHLKGRKLKDLYTLDYEDGKYSNAKIISVEDHLLKFANNGEERYVPTHLIVGLEMEEEDFDRDCLKEYADHHESECCETSGWIKLLEPLVDKAKINFNTLAEQLHDIEHAAIIGLYDGIVVLSKKDAVYAVALCSLSEVSHIKKA
ncbi:hypothetical protein [Paenibacillus roseipurpureus]|uniref:Uncharacterized protein n=1 Tax=Paenibacillus roseopurpureus TaxID=2918901 RepID=A0AA96LK62_9BACL|nr:hypothetical protein [Paenibacillus sp. MBLB1832]WNR42503.1 hypothetical protein MJB10_15365 [Paenibacillus sp. MBLB1832]